MPQRPKKHLILGVDSEVFERLTRDAPEGRMLPTFLSAAVPLWIMKLADYSDEERAERVKSINTMEPDFCCLMEYTLHRGPKEGDSAKAFNTLAEAIALMAFVPGGITVFGQHFEWGLSKGTKGSKNVRRKRK